MVPSLPVSSQIKILFLCRSSEKHLRAAWFVLHEGWGHIIYINFLSVRDYAIVYFEDKNMAAR